MGHGTPMGAMPNSSEAKITPKAPIHRQTWQIPLHYHMTTTSLMETLYKFHYRANSAISKGCLLTQQ